MFGLRNRVDLLEAEIEKLRGTYVSCSICECIVSKWYASEKLLFTPWDWNSTEKTTIYFCKIHAPRWDTKHMQSDGSEKYSINDVPCTKSGIIIWNKKKKP